MAERVNGTAQVRGDVEVALDEQRNAYVGEPIALPDGSQMVFHAVGMSAERLPALNPVLPEFVTQQETVVEPASFEDYVRDYKSETAICRASLGQNRIVAVLDYHGRARIDDRTAAAPGRCAHTATLLCPFDVDYAKWREVFGNPLDQQELADFIEDVMHTIAEPAAADLLEAIGDLRIDRAVRFKSGRNQRNGTIQFVYEEVDADRPAEGTVTLPDTIKLIVPIFQGGNPQVLEAKLRYSMDKGKVAFRIVVPGVEKAERDAFRSIGEHVREATGTPVFYVA